MPVLPYRFGSVILIASTVLAASSPFAFSVAPAQPATPYAVVAQAGEQDAVFLRIRTIVSDHLGIPAEEIVPETELRGELDADELDILELVMTMEEEFGIEIPDEIMDRINTVGDLAAAVSQLRA